MNLTDIHDDWDATKRAVSALCQELWADAGHGADASNHVLLARIADARTAIHRSAEVTRQPRGAVLTVHSDLDRAASQWSERGSELHRQAKAERQRAEATSQAEAAQQVKATRVARGLPADWRTIEVQPGTRTVLEAPWAEFNGSALHAPGVMLWFDDDKEPRGAGAGTGVLVREVLDLRHMLTAV